MSEGMVRLSERRPENGQRVLLDGENMAHSTTAEYRPNHLSGGWRIPAWWLSEYGVFRLCRDGDLWMPEESDA